MTRLEMSDDYRNTAWQLSSKSDFGHRSYKTSKKNRPWTRSRPGSLNTLITLRDQREKG